MLKHSYILVNFILFSGEGHDENVLVVPTSLKLSQSLLVMVLTLPTLPQFIPEYQFSKIWIFTNNLLRHFSTYTPLPPSRCVIIRLIHPYPPSRCVLIRLIHPQCTDVTDATVYSITLLVFFTCFDIFFSSFLFIIINHCYALYLYYPLYLILIINVVNLYL